MFLRYAYVIFIGILLATFVGVGIAAFYKAPQMPDYPTTLRYVEPIQPGGVASQSTQQRMEQEKYDKDQKEWQEKDKEYNKIVSIISLVGAIIILIASLTVFRNMVVIADGFMLGGVLTLGYSIVRGFGAQDDIFRFIVVSVGLVIAVFLGYIKFIKPLEKKNS